MKTAPESLEASVEAFARASAVGTDGRVTRSRVLATAGLRLQRRAGGRRAAVAALVVVAAGFSGSVAWTAIGRWRARAAAAATSARASVAVAEGAAGGVTPPPLAVGGSSALAGPRPEDPGAPAPDGLDAESRAYGRAHEAHFVARDPRSALAAWDRYLAAYPRGAFAPEARFNRALCLVRLGRDDAAREALRPIAAGRYRASEATALIEWLDARRAP